jgi:lipopolysaccharide heptosyltransferase II
MAFRNTASRLLKLDAARICMIKPSALGDVAQTLPLLGMLRNRFPAAAISWVIRRDLAELITGHPDLADVILFDRHGSWQAWGQMLRELRRRRFDLVFDLQGLLRTGLMTLATGAPWRVGLETAREGSSLACNYLIPDTGRDVPAHLRYWSVAEALGMADHPREAHIPPAPGDDAWLADLLVHLPGPVLAIHAGAGWETKRWPVDKFAEIARRFRGSVVTVGSRSEEPLAARIIEAVHSSGRPAMNLAGRTTLKQLASLLRGVDLLVSNDSGPLHLAAAVGTPVVGIYTCTSPILSGPAVSPKAELGQILVSTAVPCAASYCKRCPLTGSDHLSCLAELSVERVWSAVARILDCQRTLSRSV